MKNPITTQIHDSWIYYMYKGFTHLSKLSKKNSTTITASNMDKWVIGSYYVMKKEVRHSNHVLKEKDNDIHHERSGKTIIKQFFVT